jgi:hypothetical protein
MSWFWNMLGSFGQMMRDARERAREQELRRMREMGSRGMAPERPASGWGVQDQGTSQGDDSFWWQDSSLGNQGGNFWETGPTDAGGGVFGSPDTGPGDWGGGDFGSGDFGGGGFDGGGGDGGGGGGGD